MIASLKHRIAFLAMTKTGSTAIETALRPQCEVMMSGHPGLKHMQLRKFNRMVRPLFSQVGVEVETTCLFREPLDWLGSWYRYRQRPEIPNARNSTADLSFRAFVEAYLSEDQPPFARIGRPSNFIRDTEGQIGIDHLFRYDQFDLFERFISDRFGQRFSFRTENVSPRIRLEVEPALRQKVEQALSEDYDIYESIRR
ncbi:hypothetical protein FHS89_000906 [Rubricella aquisinus]|uniref:Sulfotransferase family protein n=1 Tax=Rubricella aquisinus TaxID=2028108 RepID=A0A840WUL3_9RHOB|nr:gamma-glutamyl kinase [Rubricella aquisinus]MBB5514900.1 hypothetical protein [Rubricella aquisinus]